MAVPVFLNTAYRYKETLAVVDVNTIISDLDAELTSLPDPWTRPGAAGPWTSPARADGAFIKITATRIAATRIAWVVNDHNNMLVNNMTDTRQDIDVAGTTVHYYTGPFHVCISSERVTPEAWQCGILDRTPESLAIPRPVYHASAGPRTSAGGLSNQQWSNCFMLAEAATSYSSNHHMSGRVPSIAVVHMTISGSLIFAPSEAEMSGMFMGRVCQALIVDSGQAFGTELEVPLDTGVTGTFKVAGFTTQYTARIAYRKA